MITLNHEKRYTLQVGNPEHVEIVLVGCGGTGSFLALHLARLAAGRATTRNEPPRR